MSLFVYTIYGILISGSVIFTSNMSGTAKCVLFIEVSAFQGVLVRGVLQYTYVRIGNRKDILYVRTGI